VDSEAVVMANIEGVVMGTTEVISEAVELKVVGVMLITEVSSVAVAEEKLELKEMNALVKEVA
jgi:hypothetical protein